MKTKIWEEFYKFSGDMMYKIEEDAEQDLKMCSTLDESKKKEENELCKIVARIFLWMDGLKIGRNEAGGAKFRWVQGEEEDEKPEEKKLHSYYRCLIGKVTILKMLGKHCMLKEVSETVKKNREQMRTTMDLKGGNQLCSDVDFGSLYLGKRFLWDQIKKGIDDFKRTDNHGFGSSLVQEGKSKLHDIQKEGQNEGICPKEGELDSETLQNLEITVYNKEDVSLEDDKDTDPPGKEPSGGSKELEILLFKAKEAKDAARGGDDWEQRAYQVVQENLKELFEKNMREKAEKKQQALAGGEDCSTHKDDLCKRVTCVEQKWYQNKAEKVKKWDSMEDDIKGELERLSKNIITNEANMDTYCKKNEEPSSRIVTDTEIKACRYITAGLRYIYGIQKEGKDKNPEDNWKFKQTMLCLVLNAYANKLKEKVTSPCKVDVGTIKQAFDRGNDQMSDWCKEKNKNGQADCMTCERVEILTCEVADNGNRTKVEDKVKGMLSTDHNIKKTLSDINNINENLCDRAQCVTTQKTRDKREGKNNAEAKQIWEVWKGFILNMAV
ncbi:SICA antigen [Plasmodium coatneyi]|uniref:SICA antigen n=1 Tax=Plasmodium coatneyi TaxID=208452 RepID=A0A1B1E2S5_9APIC|nr:SICA antigen [Plasmodium coatneyi]ANQ09227.1 SICA antigen [Plasmodium coatneyi]